MPRDEGRIAGTDVAPEDVVADAVRQNCKSIAYTYTEPTIYAEYADAIGKLAHEEGIRNVWVSNGYMTPEAVELLGPTIDAINVDLKSLREKTYKELASAKLEGVVETLKLFRPRDIWLEITTLIIPGINDSEAELRDIAEFIASLGTEVPWHVSRFHPDYHMHDRGATPAKTLETAVRLGREAGLKYVYAGNLPGDENEHTYCPGCGRKVIERWGFMVGRREIENGACRYCETPIDGVGM
jgi:pyruvate formate lyase activating enzyme